MSEMVERVERAIQRAVDDWTIDGVVQDFVPAARAAIEAMREPTEEMMVAAEDAFPPLLTFADKMESGSYITWQAMIDASLARPS